MIRHRYLDRVRNDQRAEDIVRPKGACGLRFPAKWKIAGAAMSWGLAACLFITQPAAVAKADALMANFVRQAEFSVSGQEPDVGAVAWSPNGSQIAVLATLLRSATVYAVPGGRAVATISDLAGGGQTIDFDADGRVLIPTHHADSGALSIWDPVTGSVTAVPGPDEASRQILPNLLFDFALDRRRTRLAGLHHARQGEATTFRVAVYDTGTWRLRADWPIPAGRLAMSPDGARAALVGPSGQVDIVDLDAGKIIRHIDANRNPLRRVAWSADGRRIATGTVSDGFGRDREKGGFGPLHDDAVLQLWDAETGRRVAAADSKLGGGVEWLEFSNDGQWLVTTTFDGTCRVWDARTLALRQLVADNLQPTTALARFSPDSHSLAVVRTGLARLTIYHAP